MQQICRPSLRGACVALLAPMVLLTGLMAAPPALAGCFVDYKARQTDPLRLHYGIVELPGQCPSPAEAEAQTAARIAAGGWQLLTILGRSDTPPSDQQKADAGEHYLRY